MLRTLIALILFSQNIYAIDIEKRVAVIGAGAAGLAAAERLQAKGFKVVVFESNLRIGGKCYTIPCEKDHGVVELGAIQFGIGYSTVNYYRKAVGMRLRKYWPSRSVYFDDRGDTYPPIYRSLSQDFWPLKDALKIAREARVMSLALKRFKQINNENFVNMPEGSEFLKPFEEWADDLSLPHFKREYSIWMTAYGYGHLNIIPTYLALSLLNSSYGLIAMRKSNMNLRMLDGGYGRLLSRMAEHYELDVRTGTHIKQIDRTPDRVIINYENDRLARIEEFGHLVVASGMESLPRLFGASITNDEARLVHDIAFSPYDVAVAYIPELEKGGYVLPQFFNTLGHVVMISKNSSGGNEAILYIPRAGFQRPSQQELTASITKDLARFGFKGVSILRIEYWDNYFAHFKTASSYKLLNDIQGLNRTIYVGAMARFEIVERAMKHAHDMIDRYFSGEVLARASNRLESIRNYLSAKSKEQE